MVKVIIFDLDGTLLDTIKDINVSINKTLEYFGFDKLNIKKTKANVGYGSEELVRRVLPKNATMDVRYRAVQHYLKTYDEISGTFTKPYKGILKLVQTLKQQGYKLAIVSNKSDHLVKDLNEKLFAGLFDVAMGTKKGVMSKPHPQMLKETLKILDLSKDEAIYVGDTEVDIRTANNASIKVVACSWGFRTLDDLLLLHPKHIIRRPNQLLKVLETLNN